MTYSLQTSERERPAPASLKIAYAVAQQRVQDLHFHGVMEVIERGRGEIAAPQAVTIYARIHQMSEKDAQALKSRVMVHMGRSVSADIQHLPNTFVAIDGAVEWDVSASLVERIRKRVGGRRRHALRHWVELHSGSVEMQLLRLHVECLRNVREAAEPGTRLQDLARQYSAEMGVPESLRDALYFAFLEHEFGELGESPDAAAAGEAGAPGPIEDASEPATARLRHA